MYMNSKTFELSEQEDNDCIKIEELIALTISLLNKKGYYTKYCCSGHYDKEIDEYGVEGEDIEDISENELCQVLPYDCGSYKISWLSSVESCHIRFNEDVILPNIPDEFQSSGHDVYHMIIFYNGLIRRSDDDIKNEVIRVNKKLYEWAKLLPDLSFEEKSRMI